MFDVIIIGCGITGAALAYELSKYRLRVLVLEKENDVAMGATKANSAILHAGFDPEPGTLMAKLNVRGVELARMLCRDLDVPYVPCGSLVLAENDEQRAILQTLLERGNANGVPDLKILSGDEARAREPELSPNVTAALWAPSAAICSPWEYCLALAETAVRNGVELKLSADVDDIRHEEDGWHVYVGETEYISRFVVNAAGLYADEVHVMAFPHDYDYDILPSRGEYYLLDKCEGTRAKHVLFRCPDSRGKGVLVTPTVHGNLLVGPNAERVSGNDTANTAEGLAYVRNTALQTLPTIDFRQTIRNFSGVRARSNSSDFIIRFALGGFGFLELAGICSPGLSAAPAVAEYAAELLHNAGLPLERKPDFISKRHVTRFRKLSAEEKAAVIAQDDTYGHIICRCETVTEGEILACFRSPIPPRSVDGVKRRVNAGMGRCQGGFCGPRVVEILSRELGIRPDKVLQDGEGTQILLCPTKGGSLHV